MMLSGNESSRCTTSSLGHLLGCFMRGLWRKRPTYSEVSIPDGKCPENWVRPTPRFGHDETPDAKQDQHFQDSRYVQELSNLTMSGQLSTLSYPHEQQFKLKHRWWEEASGLAQVQGPDGSPWFELIR